MTKLRKSVKIKAIKNCIDNKISIYKAHKYRIAERTLAVLVGITKQYGLYKACHLRKHWRTIESRSMENKASDYLSSN